MQFGRTTLEDAFLVTMEPREDDRGWFARTFCRDEFLSHGLIGDYPQTNHSHNRRRGTLRGLHFQREPHGEAKLVRCVRGAIYDVIADLRPSSPTFRRWEGFTLTEDNQRLLYVPPGFAHGFLTLEDSVDVVYQVSHPYTPSAEGGVRYDDPALGIVWPEPIVVISEKDAAWPMLD
jgi:dTDP-4-dehydrorhamnose 3,5-epimerase